MMAAPLQSGQLRWRCRRGMKELDILLERYLARRWDDATAMRNEQPLKACWTPKIR